MNSEIKQILTKELLKIISSNFSEVQINTIDFERPVNEEHGDLSTNIGMVIASKLKTNPREVSQQIVDTLLQNISENLASLIKNITIAGPGFINVKIDNNYYLDNLKKIGPTYGEVINDKSEKIIVEYGQPNTHKLPHIGHMYSYIVGESFSRILEYTGKKVIRDNYQGDVGPHVAKTIYGWRKLGRDIPEILVDKVRLLQKSYEYGSKQYNEDDHAKSEIKKINKEIYEESENIREDYELTRSWSISYYDQFEKDFGISQDKHYYESQVWKRGKEIVENNIGSVFKKSEGAIIFSGSEVGLHDRVFLTSQNTATYEAKEIALTLQKKEDWDFDKSIVTTASEQNGYFKVVYKAIEELYPEMKGKLIHIGFGMVSLSTGKMSSRTGNILSATDLLEEINDRIMKLMKGRVGIGKNELSELSKKIALSAIKYTFLQGNILQNMKFNIDESVNFEGQSGPYIQYTYTRIQSVISQGNNNEDDQIDINYQLLIEKEEIELAKLLERFPEIVASASSLLAPHIIANYIFELSQQFNNFYHKHSINSANSQKLINARRALSNKVGMIIKTGLYLLGIDTVEQM